MEVEMEGLTVVRGALGVEEQLRMAHACLAEYSTFPYSNVTNLEGDGEYGENRRLWSDAVESGSFDSLNQLRWVNIGYRYDWTNRLYDLDDPEPMPPHLASCMKELASKAGYPTFDPQTAIINYYHANSVMGGHVDDAELNMNSPVVSLSLGSSCIFLIGGTGPSARDTAPQAVLLRSGDLVLMGGAARKAIHGVARIIPLTETEVEQFESTVMDMDHKQEVIEYLKTSRINCNVRQVV